MAEKMVQVKHENGEVEIKVKVPRGLIVYCANKGIVVQEFIDVAIKNLAFDVVYKEITS